MRKKQNTRRELLTSEVTERLATVLARWLIASRECFVWCMRTATKGLSPARIKIITVIAVLGGSALFGEIIVRALMSKQKGSAHLPVHFTLPARPLPSLDYSDDGLDKALGHLQEMRSQDSVGYVQFLRRHPGFEDTLIKLQKTK